nr:ATP-binding protein [Bacillus sp. FJAT-45350]
MEKPYHYPVQSRANKPALIIDVVPAKDKLSDKFKRLFTKTNSIKWSDFFEVEKNKMVVYRVTPHSNVSNNTKRLWRAIYKMYEMYEKPGARLERDGYKLTYREKDVFWFDVVFKMYKGERKVEFYISTSEFQAQKLKRKIENKMAVTITEATISDLFVPEDNTIVQEMRYLKHDIFSMNTNSTEQKTPISSIMNTLDELQFEGDIARLSVCNEAENRQKWVRNASWAAEKMGKGKVPQRATLNGRKFAATGKTAIGGIVNEINSLLVDAFQAISNVFFKSDKDFDKKKMVESPYSLEDEINARKTTTATNEKFNQPVFKSRIRVASHSTDKLTRDTISETLSSSFGELAENNELHGVKINFNGRRVEVIRELNTLNLTKKTRYDANVNLISTEEMSKLALQMPTAEIQRRYEEALNSKRRVETDIPSAVTKSSGLKIGGAELKDREIPVYIPTKDKDSFYSGYTFIGKQGSGKDNTIQNFVYEGSMNHNISFVIPDWICQEGPKGMADGIRDLLPPEKIIDLDLSNEDHIIPMDLTEVINKIGRKGASVFATEMIGFMELEGLARSQKYLMEASKASGGSLQNIKRIIEDEDYRFERIEQLQKEGNLRLASELINWGTNEDLSNKADPIINRLNMFFGDDNLYDIFAQPPKEEVNFEKWMREGKVIIIRMPKRKIGSASKVLAHWVTLKVLMTRFLMSDADKEKHGCFMVFNEPEQVETRGLAQLMGRIATEGRKERLGSIFAFHHWNKLPDYLQENLTAGGVNQFLFANDHKKTFERVKERLEPTFTLEQAIQTPKHYAICILNTKESLAPFMVHMSPPISNELRYDNSFLTKRHAQMFGRRWEEIQQYEEAN